MATRSIDFKISIDLPAPEKTPASSQPLQSTKTSSSATISRIFSSFSSHDPLLSLHGLSSSSQASTELKNQLAELAVESLKEHTNYSGLLRPGGEFMVGNVFSRTNSESIKLIAGPQNPCASFKVICRPYMHAKSIITNAIVLYIASNPEGYRYLVIMPEVLYDQTDLSVAHKENSILRVIPKNPHKCKIAV